jgi:hypothetical protein
MSKWKDSSLCMIWNDPLRLHQKNVGRKVTRQKVTALGYMQLDYIALEVLTESLNMYQKASTYDRRSQLIIITGSVVLLDSIVSILVVRSNLSINLYHPTTSLSRNLFVMQGNSWNCTTKYTKWTRCCTGEKWFLLQF